MPVCNAREIRIAMVRGNAMLVCTARVIGTAMVRGT